LGIGAGNFLDVAKVPLSSFEVNGGELREHGISVT
jgi:hypothetical protein